jgi:sulfatase maturation enzyme AslB (radical SAM superfamily)
VIFGGAFQPVVSPNGEDIIFIDTARGYWFGTRREYEPYLQLLARGRDAESIDPPGPGWHVLVERLHQDGALARTNNQPATVPPVNLIIIEPSERCNLACVYCFEDVATHGPMMTGEGADRTIALMQQLNLASKVMVEFNGGETFLNFPVVRYIVEQLKQPESVSRGTAFEFTAQSNGTVMTPAIAEFLGMHGIAIGVSVDGPTAIHDRNRVFQTGRGSRSRIARNLDLLRRHGVEFGLLAVVECAEDVPSIWEDLMKEGPSAIRLNLRRTNGRNRQDLAEAELVRIAEAHYALFRRSLDVLRNGNAVVREANLCHMVQSFVTYTPYYMCMRTPCGAGIDQVVFDSKGLVWPCQVQGRPGVQDHPRSRRGPVRAPSSGPVGAATEEPPRR